MALLFKFMNLYIKIYNKIKTNVILAKFKCTGTNFIFDPNSTILTPEYIDIGDNVFIGEYAYISAEVNISDNVMIGPLVTIIGGDHFFGVKGKYNRFLYPQNRENFKKIFIENDVWVGARCTILKGVIIGTGSVVAAASTVTKLVPPYIIIGGNPAKPIKKIFSDKILFEHLSILGYKSIEAEAIIQRRNKELKYFNITELPSIEQTNIYWETSI